MERSEALAALSGLLADVEKSANGRLALVRGEAGAGKTALVRERLLGASFMAIDAVPATAGLATDAA